jgi:hypothetical protein
MTSTRREVANPSHYLLTVRSLQTQASSYPQAITDPFAELPND